jgi:hypothetical protein
MAENTPHLPTKINDRSAWPLALALHRDGSNAEQRVRFFDLSENADEADILACNLLPEFSDTIPLFLSKLICHRWNSLSKGKVCQSSPIGMSR